MWRAARVRWRTFRQEPLLGALGIISVAIGIGVNLALFSVTDVLLFRDLPYRSPSTLAHVHLLQVTGTHLPDWPVLPHELVAGLRDDAGVFEDMAWAQGWVQATVPSPGANPLHFTPVTPNCLSVLGLSVAAGRDLTIDDGRDGTRIYVLLTDDSWNARFGRRDLRSIQWTDGAFTYQVVGVLPEGFRLPSAALVARFDGVFAQVDRLLNQPGAMIQGPVARMKAGVSIATAQVAVDRFMAGYSWINPSGEQAFRERQQRVTVQPLQTGIAMAVRGYLWLATAAAWAAFVLTCANMTIVLAVRAAHRQRETAVQLALGASRERIVMQTLGEALTFAAAGGAIAWAAWSLAGTWLMVAMPPRISGFAIGGADTRFVTLVVVLPLVCTLLVSVLPSAMMTKVDPLPLLRTEGLGWRVSRIPVTGLLLCVQAAICMSLVLAAASVLPPFVRQLLAGPGFDAADLYLVDVDHGVTDDDPFGDSNRRTRTRDVTAITRRLPHAADAAVAFTTPLEGASRESAFWKAYGVSGSEHGIGPGLFRTMSVGILAGREFGEADVERAEPIAIVNQAGASVLAARRGISASQIAGTLVATSDGDVLIVGVVGDIRPEPGTPAIPALFVPVSSARVRPMQTALPVLLRMRRGQIPDTQLLTRHLDEHFGDGSVRIRSAAAMLAPAVERPRFLAVAFGLFAGIAVVLAATSLASIAGFEIIRRRRDTSIRVALGASGRQAVWPLVLSVSLPVCAGVAIGGVAARLILARWGANLPEIQPVAASYALAGLTVLILAGVAGAGPLWRATHRHPLADLK